MRKSAFCILLCLALLPLSACGNTLSFLPYAREIENMALMRAMGVDAEQSGVRVTVSSGVQSKGADKGEKPPVVLTSRAGTISGACLSMQAEGASYIYYGHVGQLLLGEALAARGVSPPLEYVLRDPEMRLDTALYVVKGATAEEAIAAACEDGSSAGERLEAMEEDAGLLSHSMSRSVEEVLEDLSEHGCSFAPAVTLKTEGDKTTLSAAGYAILRDEALVGWADGAAAHGVNLLLGQVDADVVELELPGKGIAAIRVVGAKTTVTPIFKGARLTELDIVCKVDANLVEASSALDLRDRAQLEALDHALAEIERARILSALELSQALNADFMGLEAKAGLAAPWRWRELQKQWDSAVPRYRVTMEASIRRSYDVDQ